MKGRAPVSSRPIRLIGGVAAYREGERLRHALRSLTGQLFPPGVSWREFRVVVAADDPATLEVARQCAASDPRIQLLIEPTRRGKSAALADILRRDGGDYFVLLNGDAVARLDAVAELVRTAEEQPGRPLAVMARPVPSLPKSGSLLTTALGLLWEVHDAYHRNPLYSDEIPHLSDELLLLRSEGRPELPAGIINDGAYLAAELSRRNGSIIYATQAVVEISVPGRWSDFWVQRRRIHAGHQQIYRIFGRRPGTFGRRAIRTPGTEALWVVHRFLRTRRGLRAGALLIATEAWAMWVARLEGSDPGPKYVLWRRIRDNGFESPVSRMSVSPGFPGGGVALSPDGPGPAHKP